MWVEPSSGVLQNESRVLPSIPMALPLMVGPSTWSRM